MKKNNCSANNTRVLYVSYNGVLEEILPSQVTPYLRELNKHGYDFTLLTFEKKERLAETGRQGIEGIKIELKKIGIDWHWLRYHKRMPVAATFFDILSGALYASWLIVAKKIRIVHARSIVPAVMCLLLRIFGVKFVFDTRGMLADEYVGGGHWKEGEFKYRLAKFFERNCLQAADAIAVLTKRHRDYLLSSPWLKNKNNILLEIIPCCVDLDRFRYRSDYSNVVRSSEKGNPKDEFIFTYLGKIGKHYMFEEMLDFLKRAFEALPDSKFMVISQSEQAQILNMISRAGLSPDRVILKKPFFKEIPDLISRAGAGIFFINPYKKFGSSPIKLAEFLSCGVPVIINSGIGDTEEFVKDNRIGVVLKSFDNDSYNSSLSEFLELTKEGESLNKRCRKIAKDHLSLGMGVAKYGNLYKRILGCTA